MASGSTLPKQDQDVENTRNTCTLKLVQIRQAINLRIIRIKEQN